VKKLSAQVQKKLTQAEWLKLGKRRLTGLLKKIKKWPDLLLRVQSLDPVMAIHVDLHLAGTAKMARLNTQYRGQKRPTDVLSFSAPPIFQQQGHLGELVICLPVLKSQARSFGHPATTELEILLIHGILHLLGFDHEKSAEEARVMAQWESRILAESLRVDPLTAAPLQNPVLGLIRRSHSDIQKK
jgi:probable rRNA maturation factor